jgi:AraC-like DNA-binding protein
MSYDHRLLCEWVSLSLNRDPSSSLGKLSREFRVGQRTIEKAIIAASGKTFRDLREEIMIERVRSAFTSDPTRAIKGLASDLGYKSPRSFARAIRRACGSSPEELRSRIIRDLVTAATTTALA